MSFALRSTGIPLAFALGLILPMVPVTVAFAQAGPGSGAGPGAGAPGGAAPAAGGPTSSSPPTTTFFPGGVAPPAPGQNVGGGNVQFSSSRPISGANDRDTFDFKRGGSGGSMRGNADGSFQLGSGRSMSNPGMHLVQKGDTLSGICDFYFRNPYQWPRIWSYNPQIQNPHWIYPGDQVRLRTGMPDDPNRALTPGQRLVDARRQVPLDTIFLKTEGFIEDEAENNWGEINGAREDKIFLTDFDEVYIRVASNRDLRVGQELTVYRPLRKLGSGRLVEIQGTVRIDTWNPKERIARAIVVEAIEAIERGARIGPLARRFTVTPPVRNDTDVEASVITAVRPNQLFGSNQVLFIDKGEDDGLRPGNRLTVYKKGDEYYKTSPFEFARTRIAMEKNEAAQVERMPNPRNDSVLPEEVQAELRVVSVSKHAAMAIVTDSRREIEIGDKTYARKGY
jgi:hypothetical protein